MCIKMLAKYKTFQPGQTVTVPADQAEWLVSRQYAVYAPVEASELVEEQEPEIDPELEEDPEPEVIDETFPVLDPPPAKSGKK